MKTITYGNHAIEVSEMSMTAKEVIRYDGRVVSSKRSMTGSPHVFSVKEGNEDVQYEVQVGMLLARLQCLLDRSPEWQGVRLIIHTANATTAIKNTPMNTYAPTPQRTRQAIAVIMTAATTIARAIRAPSGERVCFTRLSHDDLENIAAHHITSLPLPSNRHPIFTRLQTDTLPLAGMFM